MTLSVVVPAFNEEAWLPATLARIGTGVEVIVLDNGSTDRTAAIAAAAGARVVVEAERSVAAARNAGGRAARGDVLVFIDADALVPPELLPRIREEMADPAIIGGAADVVYHPRSPLVRAYLGVWRIVGRTLGMAQGAAQFVRRDAFEALGGYDARLFMGEDVDFFWRLRRRGNVRVLDDVQVIASSRRFDAWPLWKTLLWTNPLLILLLRRRRRSWRGWYDDPPR